MPTLGLKRIPKRFTPVFVDEELPRVFSEARKQVSQTPSEWEVVEVPSGGGFQPMDVPFKSVPVQLSAEAKRHGREQFQEAYRKIDALLTRMDRNIRKTPKSPLEKLLIALGLGLVLSGVAMLWVGFFRQSEIKLTGKGGAATLLITTGVTLLVSLHKQDRKIKTLPSRLRARLRRCLSYPDYSEARQCLMSVLEEGDNGFARIRRWLGATEDNAHEIEL